MDDEETSGFDVPLSQLPEEEKRARAGSFGGAASLYRRFRPGPPVAAVDWLVPRHVARVVDLGAGTGALTRLLVDRADEVVAVEPDDRMRSVLTDEVPMSRVLAGRGESIPLPDGCADVVLASSSWHWMDPEPTFKETARVLVPGGTLGVVWSGPDLDGAFVAQARALLAARAGPGSVGAGAIQGAGAGQVPSTDEELGADKSAATLADLIMGDARRPASSLEIPPDAAFGAAEHEIFRWDMGLDADELIGLLGTFSWIITMPEETRRRVLQEARRLLEESLGVDGEATVDVAFRADAWRARRA